MTNNTEFIAYGLHTTFSCFQKFALIYIQNLHLLMWNSSVRNSFCKFALQISTSIHINSCQEREKRTKQIYTKWHTPNRNCTLTIPFSPAMLSLYTLWVYKRDKDISGSCGDRQTFMKVRQSPRMHQHPSLPGLRDVAVIA